MKTQTLKPVFGEKHKDYINRAKDSTISVAEGAVRAGKTIDNIAAFAWMINKGVPDRIHLATGSTVANAKLNIGDANGFGLEFIFRGRCRWTKYKGNEALAIKSKGREYVVIFAGGGKSDSYKKIRGNSYGMWIATEINLHHEDTIKEAFNRQLAARVRRIFWDLNPTNPNAYIYTDYIDRFETQFGRKYNYQHFTIRDNRTISANRLAEIEAQYIPGSIWYQRDILGERCVADGLVYPMFDKQKHTFGTPTLSGLEYISIDYGTANPMAMGLWVLGQGEAEMVNEYYYSSRSARRQKTDEEYYQDLEKFAKGHKIDQVIVDPSAASFIECIRRHGKFNVLKANNSVLDGIRLTGALIQAGKLRFQKDCTNTLNEFGSYIWDTESTEDKVIKENDHAMDMIRYFCSTIMRREIR